MVSCSTSAYNFFEHQTLFEIDRMDEFCIALSQDNFADQVDRKDFPRRMFLALDIINQWKKLLLNFYTTFSPEKSDW